jgi:hypothetical protein
VAAKRKIVKKPLITAKKAVKKAPAKKAVAKKAPAKKAPVKKKTTSRSNHQVGAATTAAILGLPTGQAGCSKTKGGQAE